ncbi:MAG: hypothetical protein EZS28_056691, partial [Streblomastix strix]
EFVSYLKKIILLGIKRDILRQQHESQEKQKRDQQRLKGQDGYGDKTKLICRETSCEKQDEDSSSERDDSENKQVERKAKQRYERNQKADKELGLQEDGMLGDKFYDDDDEVVNEADEQQLDEDEIKERRMEKEKENKWISKNAMNALCDLALSMDNDPIIVEENFVR